MTLSRNGLPGPERGRTGLQGMLLQRPGRRQLAEIGMQCREVDLGDESAGIPVAGQLAQMFDGAGLQVPGTGKLTMVTQGSRESLRDTDGELIGVAQYAAHYRQCAFQELSRLTRVALLH